MNNNYKDHGLALAQFLPNMVKLNELQKMTEDLDEELAESQKIMKEIKTMLNTAAKLKEKQGNNNKRDNSITHQTTTEFLDASVPNLLMADMPYVGENSEKIEIVIANIKNYAENLRNNVNGSSSQPYGERRELENIDLKQYAASFDQLAKSLVNIKVNRDVVNNRNPELETKLTQLCEDVHSFTQMVETKTAISESNENWSYNQQTTEERNALYYNEFINKLLNSINEVTYLLKNKH